MFGPVRQNEMCRIRYNEELYQECKDIDLVSSIKFKRLQWAGCVQRLPLDHTRKKSMKAEFIGSRPVGRPRFNWEEHVKICCHSFLVLKLESDRAEWSGLEAEIMGSQGLSGLVL